MTFGEFVVRSLAALVGTLVGLAVAWALFGRGLKRVVAGIVRELERRP